MPSLKARVRLINSSISSNVGKKTLTHRFQAWKFFLIFGIVDCELEWTNIMVHMQETWGLKHYPFIDMLIYGLKIGPNLEDQLCKLGWSVSLS